MKKKLAVILMSSILAVSSLVGFVVIPLLLKAEQKTLIPVQRKQTLPPMLKQLLCGPGTTTLM